MIDNLNLTFEILKKLNSSNNVKKLSNDDLDEEEDNLRDCVQTLKKLDDILIKLNSNKIKNTTKIGDEFVYLHLEVGMIEWQFDQIGELIAKMLDQNKFKKNKHIN
ncbi:MAG: hypothetical protein WC707_04730 [Candidatus Babeliaceae bacterium]|jgi:hypothetical protein